MSTASFTIVPRGPFSLRESAMFGFGQRSFNEFDGVMRLAFCLDDYSGHVGVEVRQDDAGVHCTVHGSTSEGKVRSQVARVLSLDHDATSFLEVGDRDPVMARLLAARPGLRPPLFYSPYEAAAWSVLSARRPPKQMQEVRARLSREHGASFELAGQTLHALPSPQQMLAVEGYAGIPPVKMDRLHAVARAALAGELNPANLAATDPDAAMLGLQKIPGIGPFYSALVVIRATGVTDVLPPNEPMVREVAKNLYDLAETPTVEEFAQLAEPWRPWRTWGVVLMRAAGPRLVEQ